jgi:hypothetical protein
LSIGCKNEEEFNGKVERLLISDQVKKINSEILEAIQKAMNGEDPDLQVTMDDEKLDYDSYKQIVSKVYSVIRFKLYQKIKHKLSKSISGTISESELRECVKELDIETIR